jgi:hypothetical protein
MSEKQLTITASSNWRDSIDDAKSECSRMLDSKVQDEISDQEHDGWYLISSSYGSYSIKNDSARNLYKCSRSKSLRFREYSESDINFHYRPDTITNDFRENNKLSKIDFIKIDELQHVLYDQSKFLSQNPNLDSDFLIPLLDRVRVLVPQVTDYYRMVIPPGIGPSHPIRAKFDAPLESVTFEGLHFITSRLKLSAEAELIGLPLSESVAIMPISNCGSGVSLTIHDKVEYKYVTGYRITVDESATTKYELAGKLEFDGFGVDGSVSQEVNFRESREYSSSSEQTKEHSLDITVDSNTKVTIRVTSQLFESRRSFDGPATIGGTIVATYANGELVYRHDLTSLLPSADARTFNLHGYYSNLDTRVQPINITHESCT